ncbi:MAG: TIGR00701 family protein, partial [Mesorhizobium sp.]
MTDRNDANSDADSRGAGATRRAAIAIVIFLVLAALLFLFGPDDFYPWAKAIHVIAVISWMAGMLYLPRLLVYHADAEKGSVQSETFKVMERRLLRGIINPAMIITW